MGKYRSGKGNAEGAGKRYEPEKERGALKAVKFEYESR